MLKHYNKNVKSRLLSLLQYFIGWPITVVAFIFIGKLIWDKFPEILPHMQQINYGHFYLGTLFLIAFYFLRSYVWYLVIKPYNESLSFKKSSYLWSISELKRYVPGNIWSLLGRTHLFHHKDVGRKKIFQAMVWEAEYFIIGCAVVSVLSLGMIFPSAPNYLITVVICMLLLLLVGFVYTNKIQFSKNKIVRYISPDVSLQKSIVLIVISVLSIMSFGIGNYFIMTSVFITEPGLFWQFIGLFSFAFLAGYLALIAPAGFGVREGILIAVLSKFVDISFGAFIALYTRFMLMIAELLFIFLIFLWVTFQNKWIHKLEALIVKKPYESILSVFVGIYSLYFTHVTFLKYENYYTGRFDLGNMVQTVWNTMHGKIFLFTNPDSVEQISRLAFHADYVLILLAPLYAIWSDPRMLLLIQTIVLSVGAFYVYYIAQFVLRNNVISLVFAIAFLANPLVQRTNLYDFHAVTLATTFFLAVFYYFLRKNYSAFYVFAILAGFCKEQLWLIIALFGIAIFFYYKKRIIGLLVTVLSLGMFYVLFWYAIPNARGGEHFALSYLSEFGDTPSEVVSTFVLEPQKVLAVFNHPERVDFIKKLLSPLGYLPLVFPFTLIFAGPDLMISLLSSNSQLRQIYYQYTATITPFLFISAIYGVWVIRKFIPTLPTIMIIIYIVYSTWNASMMFGPLPGAKKPDIAMITMPLQDKAFIDSIVHSLPSDVSVSASNNLGSHLSARNEIFTIPLGIGKADKILILLNPYGNKNTKESEMQFVRLLQNNPQYVLQIERGNFYVFDKIHKE